MPVIPLPLNAVTLLSFYGSLHEQRVINTFHLQFQGTPSGLIDYREYYGELWTTLGEAGGFIEKYLALLPTNMTVLTGRLQTVFPNRQRYVELGINQAGTSAGGANSTPNVAFSIRRVSDTIGQQGVGRVQIPIAQNWIDNGNLAAGAVAPINAFLPFMKDNIVTADPDAEYAAVLYGVTNGATHVSQVIDAQPEYTVRVMRRRTVRVGE